VNGRSFSTIIVIALLFAGVGLIIPYLPQPAKDIIQLVHAFMELLILGFLLNEIFIGNPSRVLQDPLKEGRAVELMSSVSIVLISFACGLANFALPGLEESRGVSSP
jgi:hypothetical protein